MTLYSTYLTINPNLTLVKLREFISNIEPTKYGYIKLALKGQFELHDYEAGVYYVYVQAWPSDNKKYVVQFLVGCLDDGAWSACSKPMSKCDAKELVEVIKKEVLVNLYSLPNEVTLNKLLQSYHIQGKFE